MIPALKFLLGRTKGKFLREDRIATLRWKTRRENPEKHGFVYNFDTIDADGKTESTVKLLAKIGRGERDLNLRPLVPNQAGLSSNYCVWNRLAFLEKPSELHPCTQQAGDDEIFCNLSPTFIKHRGWILICSRSWVMYVDDQFYQPLASGTDAPVRPGSRGNRGLPVQPTGDPQQVEALLAEKAKSRVSRRRVSG